ncbi:hypothetical protein GCM10008995_18460 [Halobellus salinus]|uniref:DUF7310 domain-containing protein n=1 Tax=Halobellus salinus TaxID=931585 RepID=A0A830EBH5_9EURY|nr:hypothetical protein [Halobellus salinus]GGJ08880.1 hypothetical protein GCM10008995_18460 [Halobellus salinus]SMP27045.1 hypothetical protein SAMN06265347_11218 [Halobellus salinus]
MPTETTPSEPSTTTPPTADRVAHDRPADTTEATGSDEPGSGPSDVPESVAAPDRGANGSDTDRVAALERRVTDLEAELDAVRGLLDGVETVDERVERRASAALSKAETLEKRFTAEATLVRERLPDPGGDRRREGSDDRTPRRRTAEPDPEDGPQAGSQIRDGVDQGAGRHAGAPSTPEPDAGASTGPPGNGRSSPATANATDGGSAGPGAITSVGSGRSADNATRIEDNATRTDDAERSLATRLRDAFR